MGQPDPSTSSRLVAERLLQVIDEGRRTATYKLALILALMDATAEGVNSEGKPPDQLHTRTIAEHVVRLYYRQVGPYVMPVESQGPRVSPTPGHQQAHVLRQIRIKKSKSLEAVLGLRLKAGGVPLNRALASLPEEYQACLDRVELNFAQMPILRLQNVGSTSHEFLYSVDWGERVTLSKLHSNGGGILRMRPGAGTELLRLAPLIRPLVELHWVREVADINKLDLEGERLHAHLFGADRIAVPAALRSCLLDLQGGDCFYCGDRLPSNFDVDHFMPWSRWPNNAIENLVAADTRCNNSKRDQLASANHVDHWATRLHQSGADLATAASDTQWESAPARSTALARAGYAAAPQGTPLWSAVGSVVEEELDLIHQRLAGLKGAAG
jgi:5-methylcytosine-specific restriction endonuclease McrA